jgi:hypothetical protein
VTELPVRALSERQNATKSSLCAIRAIFEDALSLRFVATIRAPIRTRSSDTRDSSGENSRHKGFPFHAYTTRPNVESLAGKPTGSRERRAPAAKWIANQKPVEDLATIERLMHAPLGREADRFVLISTVDVYPRPSTSTRRRRSISTK